MHLRRFALLLAPEAGPEGAPAPAGDAAPAAASAPPESDAQAAPKDAPKDKAHVDAAKAKLREILDARKAKKEQATAEATGKELPADVRARLDRLATIEKTQAARIDKAVASLPAELRSRISRVPDLDDREALATALVAQAASSAAPAAPAAAKADPAAAAGGPASTPATPVDVGRLLATKGAAYVERHHPKEWTALLKADSGNQRRTMFSPSKE